MLLTLVLLFSSAGCGLWPRQPDLGSSLQSALEAAKDSHEKKDTETQGDAGAADAPIDAADAADTAEAQAPEEEQQTAAEVEEPDLQGIRGYPGWTDHVPFAEVPHGKADFADLSYSLYDTERFEGFCDALLNAPDGEAAVDAFNALYDEYVAVESNYTLCYIAYCNAVADEKLMEDQATCEKDANDCWDRYCATLRDALNGTNGDALRAYLGDEAADTFLDYEDQEQEEKDLMEEENRLVARYFEEMDDQDRYTYTYNDQEWTLSKLQGPMGSSLNYDDYYAIYEGITGKMNAVVGQTFLELVAVRQKIAELNGYDNYADYAYENVFLRDYSPEDAQALCDSVKKYVAPTFYSSLYYSSMWSRNTSYKKSGEEIMNTIGTYCGQLDPRIREAWEYITDHGYYHIDGDSSMMNAGYTTTISTQRAPFIFIHTSNDLYDLSTAAHEFGHACDAYWNQSRDVVLEGGCYDIFEIHSTGMEVMFQRYYSDFLGRKSETLEFECLFNLLYCVISGCLQDEFQRIIYANPDMTLDEINTVYYNLCRAYGEPEPTLHDYYWIFINHTFESPCYYISYAASALASLQLWDLQQEDPDAALEKYMEILGLGAYDYGYMELLEEVGLKSFAQEGVADEVCRPVVNHLRSMG